MNALRGTTAWGTGALLRQQATPRRQLVLRLDRSGRVRCVSAVGGASARAKGAQVLQCSLR